MYTLRASPLQHRSLSTIAWGLGQALESQSCELAQLASQVGDSKESRGLRHESRRDGEREIAGGHLAHLRLRQIEEGMHAAVILAIVDVRYKSGMDISRRIID